MVAWTNWASLGGQLGGGEPAVARNTDGRLEVFAASSGPSGPDLVHIWQTATGNGWSGWDDLGAPPPLGGFLGSPAVGQNQDGRLEAFVRMGAMSAGTLWHIWQTAPGAGWSGWDDLGGDVGAHIVVVGQNADGRLEVFGISSVGVLQHVWQVAPNGDWRSWGNLGTPSGVSLTQGLAVTADANGALHAFAAGTDGNLWHIAQQAPNSGWGGWNDLGTPLGGTIAVPAAGRNADGRLEVVAVSQDALWHIWQTSPGGSWSSWGSLGTPPGVAFLNTPTLVQNADGRLEVFTFGTKNAVWHIWQTAPGGGWSGWDSLGGAPGGAVGVIQNADGRLEAFTEPDASTTPQPLWHRWQISAGGGWST